MFRTTIRFSFVALSFVALSVVNSGCGSDTDYYDANAIHANAVEAYKANFEAAYGKVDPNQNWDFSGVEAPALTRGTTDNAIPTIGWEMVTGVKSTDYDYLVEDFHYQDGTYQGVEALKNLIDNTEAVAWPYKYAKLNIYPVICHGNTSKYLYLYFGVDYTYKVNENKTKTESNNCQVNVKGNFWYSIFNRLQGPNQTNDMNFNSYRVIDTRGLTTAKSMNWWVGYKKTGNTITKINLETCKLFTVNGHQYVAFNCDGDTEGDYTDLICRLDGIELLPPTSKRYLVEDLGSTTDFDFNDIVFDVDDVNGEQYCTVRALGGTLDIEIQVGDSTWKKSNSQYPINEMINTKNPNYSEDYYLARFKVTGWKPSENNVCVNVYVNGQAGMYVIEFPAYGDVPMMVAVNRNKWWRVEYDRIPNAIDWFIAPNPTEN